MLCVIDYIKPRPTFTNFLLSVNSFTRLSKIPLIKILLLGVEYSFAISKYSFKVTFTGIDGNFKNSQIAIFNIMVSTSAIRSLSQFGVLSSYVLANSFHSKPSCGTNPLRNPCLLCLCIILEL